MVFVQVSVLVQNSRGCAGAEVQRLCSRAGAEIQRCRGGAEQVEWCKGADVKRFSSGGTEQVAEVPSRCRGSAG